MRHLLHGLRVRVASIARRLWLRRMTNNQPLDLARGKQPTTYGWRGWLRSFVVGCLLLVTAAAPMAQAAVPTYIVEIELNTKFERSLEKFLFDLFNTLQRREEDFTAAFELQKIEKAREDTAKLFQEVQEELQDFGQAFDLEKVGASDERLEGTGAGLFQTGENPLFISPLKGNRIINDPLEFLNGEPMMAARIVAACIMNYSIWDQEGKTLWDDSRIDGAIRTALLDGVEKESYGRDPEASVLNLKRAKAKLLTTLQFGDWPFYAGTGGSPLQLEEPVGLRDSVSALFNSESFATVYPRCDASMKTLRLDTPISAAVKILEGLGHSSLDPSTPREGSELATPAAKAAMIRSMLFLTTLPRNIIGVRDATWEEISEAFGAKTAMAARDVAALAYQAANSTAIRIAKLRELQFLAGQGIRPENLYLTQNEPASSCPPELPGLCREYRIELNTEYVISPAVVLLQKMQAATQAQFDLAGQGFLYLDAVSTPDEVLGAYNLVRASSEEERKICNNAGACQILDVWLKPAASFRSVVTLQPEFTLNTTRPKIPQIIGPGGDYPGSGLPAPWEDPGFYANVANEKVGAVGERDTRYTVGRFLPNLDGFDEFDGANFDVAALGHSDNLGNDAPGYDYPINDYYDRVFEMYEAGIGRASTSGARSGRVLRFRQFSPLDWECYIALWFFEKPVGSVSITGGVFGGLNPFDIVPHCFGA